MGDRVKRQVQDLFHILFVIVHQASLDRDVKQVNKFKNKNNSIIIYKNFLIFNFKNISDAPKMVYSLIFMAVKIVDTWSAFIMDKIKLVSQMEYFTGESAHLA
jgi:hypothetical protein